MENSRNIKSDLLSKVKLQKLKPTCLFLKQWNGALECVLRRTRKRITMADQNACFIFRQNLLLCPLYCGRQEIIWQRESNALPEIQKPEDDYL